METKRDVYSLGIIIWEMLSREVVWKNKTLDELQYLVVMGERVPIYFFPKLFYYSIKIIMIIINFNPKKKASNT